jgi:predicted RNA-binding protein with PIN domain
VAVEALLQVGGLELMLDGYNVTKDLRGRAKMSLHDQRLWLLRTVAGATAMYDVRPTIVFDAQAGVGGLAPSARGVRTVFTATNELADDRIKEYVRALPATTAVLVVTGDREIRDDVRAHHGDVVSSGVFLRAIGASW